MARHRRKTRTHATVSEEELAKIPRSMVISVGEALKNHSVTQLVGDMRNVMQPHTAINLKERKANKLKDFVVMAGPLGVSHLMVFSTSESGNVTMRLSRLPRGPTIAFKVKNFSLIKDVKRILKHPKSVGKDSKDFVNPPLLVLNGFTAPANAEPHEKVLITLLQSMFPPISPEVTKVSSIRRVLVLNRSSNGEIDLRHYSIDTKPVEISKSIKKLVTAKENVHRKLPNLARVHDVSEFVLDPYANGAGFTSDSEIEDDEVVQISENNPRVSQDHKKHSASKKAHAKPEPSSSIGSEATRKRAVKLTEIGPRLKLDLIKIEEGVCEGKVLYHSRVKKTQAEINKLEQRHTVRRKLKQQRKKEQDANIEAKKEKKEAKKLRRKQRKEEGGASDSESEEDSEEDEEISDGDNAGSDSSE